MRVVTPDYFQTMGMPGAEGPRVHAQRYRAATARLVVINEAFAAKYFPNEDPIGRTLNTGFDELGERIIGVVEHRRGRRPHRCDRRRRATCFTSTSPWRVLPGATFVLRAAGPEGMATR